MKPYFIGKENFDGEKFHLNTTKHFYVFLLLFDMDTNFDFNIKIPDEKLTLKITTIKTKEIFDRYPNFRTKRRINLMQTYLVFLRFPLITLQIIGLIHWNAFKPG